MSGSNRRNEALRQPTRPGSPRRRASVEDPLRQNDSPCTGSVEADLGTLIDATAALQTVNFNRLRKRLNMQSAVPDDLKIGHDEQEVSIRRAENIDLETKYLDLKEKYDKLTKQIEEKQELEDKLKNITAQLKTTELTSSEQKKEIILLQQRVESGDKSMKALNQKLKECMNELHLKKKRLQRKKSMNEIQKSKDDALTRPVHHIGQQISEGDPNISDLSEQNRPSKLGEMYSELYDNEWTDAFEVLIETFHFDDLSAIQLLLKILWESSKHASDVSQSAMKTIENLLSGSSEGPTPDCRRLLREARKHVDINNADSLLQDFREKLTRLVERIYLMEKKVAVYTKKCFQLCWLMSIQDPPIVLSKDPERGSQFDTNLYKHYTHSGDNIDYVVWPALLLHKHGPLLARGVAEPYTRPRPKTTPSIGKSETKDDVSFDRRSQIQNDENLRESASSSDRMDTTQHGNDESLSPKSGHSPKVKQTYPIHDIKKRVHSTTPTAPAQIAVSERKQLYQNDVFKSKYDKENFQRFCQDILKFREQSLRLIYETDYDRYYTLYLNQKYGH